MEIQTIHLYRDTDKKVRAGKGEQIFAATDYFDCLIAKKRKLNDTFCSIMNLEQDGIVENDTSMQSYTLYFSRDMEKAYDRDMKKSPFDQHEYQGEYMPFLSIIQIHITTESLRRIKLDSSIDTIEQYQKDIADILRKFRTEEKEEVFVYRVYKILSAGDFAVVVRSKLPETSFKISTLIRCRMAGCKCNDGTIKASKWALYKTYTLLTFDEKLGAWKSEESNAREKGEFVIRGCYSCKYWADDDIKTTYQNSGIDSLNGRYDFSVKISENEFYSIYEYIKNYKDARKVKIEDDALSEMTNAQMFLVRLAQDEYLSYLNIRYLIPEIPEKYRLATESDKVLIEDSRESAADLPELKKENFDFLEGLRERYKKLEKDYTEILKSQQNAEQYVKMLGKSIRSCYSLNNQPDTRIYVVGIGEQLEIVLNGMSVYFELYSSADKAAAMDIARLAVSYIRIAVNTIDNYLDHVRNNNLQSLQTPNYNLESNMGMEKILIAYSEYLMNITGLMSKYLKTVNAWKEFYPIVVPDLNQPDICVETLFIDGYGVDNAAEQIIRTNMGCNSYMMVIGSPTLSELGDIPIFTAMLFHELAHQYRYEPRKNRNKIIRRLVLREYANMLADNIIGLSKHETGVQDEEDRLFSILTEVFYDGLDKNVFTDSEIAEKEWDTPLIYFKECLKNYIEEFNFYFENQLDIESRTVKFVRDLSGVVEFDDKECKEYLICLCDNLNGKSDGLSFVPYLEKLLIISFKTAFFYAVKECSIDPENDEIKEILDLENIDHTDINEIQFEALWEKLKQDTTAKQKVLEQIKGIWESYAVFVEDWCSKVFYCENDIKYGTINDFKNYVYQEICNHWKRENRIFNQELLIKDYREWTLLGRWLQVDNDQSKEAFWDRTGSSFGNIQWGYIDNVISKYREVTSDIAMYAMMNLSPFEYVKLMTTILAEDDILNTFSIDRIITVISVMESTDNEAEKLCETFWQKEKEVVEKLKKFCENLKGDVLQESVKKGLDRVLTEMTKEGNTYSDIDILTTIKEVEQTKDNRISADDEILSCIIKILKVLDRLLFTNVYYIGELCRNSFLLNDYREGAAQLNGIMEKIDKDNDLSMTKIKKMCDSSKGFISKKHYKTGEVKDSQFNAESIEFLLDLYYKRKIRNSRWTYEGIKYEDSYKNN